MAGKTEHFTDELFVGARLGAARAAAGISLEQAARDTRIRVQRLREIEADDFSGFVHPTYVRFFLIDYANYLGVPVEQIRPLLPEPAKAAAAGFQYIDALGRGLDTPGNASDDTPPGLPVVRLVIIAIAALLVIAGGIYGWMVLKKIGRISTKQGAPTEQVAKVSPTPVPAAALDAEILPAAPSPAAAPVAPAGNTEPNVPAGSPSPTPEAPGL